MKLKRITAALLAGVMCVGLLAGCGSKGDGDEKGSGDKITIRLLTRMAGTTAQVDIYNDILDEFKEKHPEVTIVDDSQGDESAFNNILSTDIASGTMANIFRIQGVANLSEYIDNGLILDVQPYLDEDPEWGGGFTEGALSYYQVPGKEGTYAIPMESGLIGVYYNKDLFDKYNQVYLKENFLIQNDYALIEYREIQRKGRVRNVVNNRRNHKYHLDLACIGEEDGRVLLSDLSIGMTEDQKLFIFSEKLNKRCKIITDNMLNPKLCSKLFYFMDAISKEYEDNVTLRKYMLYENVYNFTPRIVIDNFTVSLKTWKFSNQSIKCTDINSFIQCFDKLRNDYSIDQYVYFCESDNRLVINLNKRYSYDILYSAFKRTNQVELTELEPGFMQDEILSDERGQKYEAEFTFSFIQRKSIQKMKNTSYALLKANRILELGDEGWIYIKVYGLGTRTNEFLTKSIPRLIKELDCEKWFFIRYSDPCEHIRFRIKFQNEDTAYTKLKGIMEWIHILKKRGMVEKVIFDTYKREINRYGGEQLIDYAETIFYLDSQLVIEILSNFNIEQEEDKEKLYFVGIAKIYKLFTDKLEDIFKLIDTDQREQYRNDYKTKRNVYLRWFEDILNDNLSNIDARFSNLDSLMKWEEKIKKYRNELDLYTKDNMLCTNKTHLILSFSHMYCNRLNGSLTTEQKYRSLLRHTLYDYLKRLEYKKK